MRFVLRILIPVLVFGAVLYLVTRARKGDGAAAEPRSDTAAFVTILVVSAVVALGTVYALVTLWD